MLFDKQAQRQRAINQAQALINQGIAPPVNPMPPIKPRIVVRDMQGRELALAQQVVRPIKDGNISALKISTITHIAGNQVYCDNSRRAIGHPERMLILR